MENVYPVFQRTNEGKTLAKRWDDSLRTLYDSGFLNEKFLEYEYEEYTGPKF